MAIGRNRRGGFGGSNYWPGFVDAMATLLLVVTFLLSVFMLAQYFVTQEASGKNNALNALRAQIAQLTELLALEASGKKALEDSITILQSNLSDAEDETKRLKGMIGSEGGRAQAALTRSTELSEELSKEKKISSDALAAVQLLNQQIAALRRQIAALESALDASETRDRESQSKIADLGRRLNVALARKVQELARYRSDFFGRLREVLRNRANVEVVGDRFVFPAEIFFDSGKADLRPAGRLELSKLADILKELEGQIPDDINWVLRIDGHTDINPIASVEFPSNWELSSARAIAVVRYLMSQGVAAKRLVAAGFGEFHPLDQGTSAAAFRRNRRIELKLTER